MKSVPKITINKDSDFWKSLQESANLDAEKAAAAAAERVRKETLERAEKRAAEKKAYLDSIRFYDKLEFENKHIREQIKECIALRADYAKLASDQWSKQEELRRELQSKCSHKEALETRTTWEDDYGSYHDGHYERKCIECYLVEQSDYHPSSRGYSVGSSKRYNKLANSHIVILRKTVDDKEYELEFDDLKW